MQRMITTIFILFFSRALLAPVCSVLPIVVSEPINYYEPLIRAVVKVESNGNTFAYNPDENAVGAFQIRPIRVIHYNKLIGANYKLNDFYDYELSRKMFLYYANGKSYEMAAKKWNGSGPLTKKYWGKVKAQLL